MSELSIKDQEEIMNEFYHIAPPKTPKTRKNTKIVYKTSNELYELAKEQKQKHQHKLHKNKIEFINEDPVLSLNWSFYREELVAIGKERLIKKYKLDDMMYDFDTLKELIVSVFSSGSEDYEYIMGLDTLWGWKELASPQDIKEKIYNWVNNSFKPVIDGDEEKFLTQFRIKVASILSWKSGMLEQETSIDDFVTNIASTGTSGSAFDSDKNKVELKYKGEGVKFTNNKYAKSAYLSAQNKKDRLKRKVRQKANVSQKIEFWPKVRIIVSSDFDTTMKMRFIDTWLQSWMKGNANSTLWQTKQQSFDMWLAIAKNESGYNIPIDQSAFDHHVTKRMVMVMLEEIRELIETRAINNDELLEVMDSIIYALDGGKVYYKDPKTGDTVNWTYESGILSGWQWTAFLDTLANIAENLMAQDQVRSLGVDVQVLQFNAQGDDDLLRVNSPAVAFGILTAMRRFGFEIHKYKSFISKKHNEYLRRYAKDKEVNGYPARMVNNLLWLYPGDRYQKSVLSRLSGAKDKWVKFYERMKNSSRLVSTLKREYSAMKIDPKIYIKYLGTKRTYGGAGLIKGDEDYIIEEYNPEAKEEDGGFSLSRDLGYQDFQLRFGRDQTREMEQWMIKSMDPQKHTDDELIVVAKPQPELQPLTYLIMPSVKKPSTKLVETLAPNVVFGKSREFMQYAFPNIDTFTQLGRAPKSWIYDYLTNRLKPVTPKISNMSDEFSSMLYDLYEGSIIAAMYFKKTVKDKWVRLNLYAEEHFPIYISQRRETYPKMY